MDQQDDATRLQAVLDSANVPVSATELIEALAGAGLCIVRTWMAYLDDAQPADAAPATTDPTPTPSDPQAAALLAALLDDETNALRGDVAQIIDEALDARFDWTDDADMPGSDIVDDIVRYGIGFFRHTADAATASEGE